MAEHSLASVDDKPYSEGGVVWLCTCGADGFDMYDLITHANGALAREQVGAIKALGLRPLLDTRAHVGKQFIDGEWK